MGALNAYIISYLGGLTSQIYSSGSQTAIDLIESETLVSYGDTTTTEAQATDKIKLHKLSHVESWKRLLVETSASFDFSADGGSYKTSQIYSFLQKNLTQALYDASEYLNVVDVVQHNISRDYSGTNTSASYIVYVNFKDDYTVC